MIQTLIRTNQNFVNPCNKFGIQHSLNVNPSRFIHKSPALNDNKKFSQNNHTPLWIAERVLSSSLLGTIPLAFIYPSQITDALMAISIVVHQHWGLETIITEYLRPKNFGNVVPKVAHGLLILLSGAILGGLFHLAYNDIGITNTIKKFWAIKGINRKDGVEEA